MVLASFTQNMNIKCCEFLCQVVQKYIINNLVKKKEEIVNHLGQSILCLCYFLKQSPHNYGVYEMAEKEEGRRSSLYCVTRNTGIKWTENHTVSTAGGCRKQTRFRNVRKMHSLQ